LVQPPLYLGRPTEQIPGPREGVRGRLVGREEDRHCLVAHLPVGHPPAPVLVTLCHEQQREESAAISKARTALANDAVDDPIQPFARLASAAHLWNRKALKRLAK